MKIKLIIFFVIAVMGLQGFQIEQKEMLTDVIYKALQNSEKNQPVVFYDMCKCDDIKTILEDSNMKMFLQNEANSMTEIIVISDTDEPDRRREIVKIELGKICDKSANIIIGNMQYEKNQITPIVDKHGGIDLKKEMMLKKIVNLYFNTYRRDCDQLTVNRYKEELNKTIGETPVVVIVGPEYEQIDVENVCQTKNVLAIVCDKNKIKTKKVVWWRSYWKELVGFSFVTFIGIFVF